MLGCIVKISRNQEHVL